MMASDSVIALSKSAKAFTPKVRAPTIGSVTILVMPRPILCIDFPTAPTFFSNFLS